MSGTLRANLSAAIIASVGGLQGWLFFQSAQQQAATLASEQYHAAAQVRHARILGVLEQRRQSLETLVAFYQASGHVSAHDFSLFSENLLSGGLRSVCWNTTTGAPESFSAGEQALCRHFDVLEPSQALSSDPPLIVLSAFTASGEEQAGFVSVIFSVSELFYDVGPVGFGEYLVANNSIQNSITAYAHPSEAGRDLQPVASLAALPPVDSYDLLRLGNMQLVYLTHPAETSPGQASALTIALMLSALGIVGALLVRNLVLTREVVRREVEHRTAELSQFAYRTSHDIRGPLASITGLCHAILEDLSDGELEEVEENVERIQRLAVRLDRLSGDILALTQADLGRPEAEPVDLRALIEGIHDQFEQTGALRGVRAEADVQVPARLMLSRARLSQILENLISNGVKYASPEVAEPWVRTRARLIDHRLVIEISDNGLGIPEGYLPRLFVMFERFHPDVAPGSGLGLPIVKKHVERLGGDIQVQSDQSGTTFTITLPNVTEEP